MPFETIDVPNHDRSAIIKLTGGAYYQVPVLKDAENIVFESGVDTQDVARYVDERYAQRRLFPPQAEGLQAILIPYLENEVEGVTFKLCDIHGLDEIEDLVARTMTIRHKERRFGRGCVAVWKREKNMLWQEAKRLLTPFDVMLKHARFVLGGEPAYVDFLLYGVLGNLTYRDYNPLPRLAHLQRWHDEMRTFRFSQ